MASPAVQNLVISLVAMQLARKIPFDDPQTLNVVRVGYVTTQLVILSTYYYISNKIKQQNDTTVLKYVEPANAMTKEPGALVTTTVRDYDLQETSKQVRGVFIGLAMMCFLHLYMHYTQPLFIQALMGFKNLYDSKIVAIHILGKPTEGDLKRPFKSGPSMFGASADPQTDKAAIDEAEKRVGPKKDDY